MSINVLILGGTAEGRQLAEQLEGDERFQTLLSYAGRTERLQHPRTPHRVGGFGGSAGLAAFLREGQYDALIDATHPFAARISESAVNAAELAKVPLLRFARPLWTALPDDRWREVDTMEAAVDALGAEPRRVFLTVGKQEAHLFARAPQHHYLVRSVDSFDPGLPHAELLSARGPFMFDAELALLRSRRIELLVTKNAGTDATYAKLEAARVLGVPVVMVRRPLLPPAPEVTRIEQAVEWVAALHGRSRAERGV
jgi:precorrin-6A/cobalt-precorrin-6A reductase